MTQLDALKAFAVWALTEGPFDGCDLDGGDVQEQAAKLGLVNRVAYDPAKHGEIDDATPGEEIFYLAPFLQKAAGGCDHG